MCSDTGPLSPRVRVSEPLSSHQSTARCTRVGRSVGQTLQAQPAQRYVSEGAVGRPMEEQTDSGCRQKPICWQRWKPSAQLPSPPSQQQLKGWDSHSCPGEPVRLFLSRPGPGGRGWPPQASAATYGSGGVTSSWLLQDFPVLKTGSLFPRSQAESLRARDPERAFKVQTVLGPPLLGDPQISTTWLSLGSPISATSPPQPPSASCPTLMLRDCTGNVVTP